VGRRGDRCGPFLSPAVDLHAECLSDPHNCDDSNVCTTDTCNAGTCTHAGDPCVGQQVCDESTDQCTGTLFCAPAPQSGCRTGLLSSLKIKETAMPPNNGLIWKLTKGDSALQSDFGDPTASTNEAMCIYVGGNLVDQIVAPSGSHWAKVRTKGYMYKDKSRTSDGVNVLVLTDSDKSRSQIHLTAKGANIPALPGGTLPVDSADFPVTAQLVNDTNSVCWTVDFAEADTKKNDGEQFRAVKK